VSESGTEGAAEKSDHGREGLVGGLRVKTRAFVAGEGVFGGVEPPTLISTRAFSPKPRLS
jgi:hypothetical protein